MTRYLKTLDILEFWARRSIIEPSITAKNCADSAWTGHDYIDPIEPLDDGRKRPRIDTRSAV